MRKVLIVARHLQIGGIQKSLTELLKVLAKDDSCDVTLFCCLKRGPFLESIPENIHILDENPYAATTEMSFSDCLKSGVKYALFRFFASGWSKLFTKKLPVNILTRLVGTIGDEYDVAISYAQPTADRVFCGLGNELVLNCTRASRKISFVHCDFANYGGNTETNRKMYKQFDYIAAVSDSVGESLGCIIPDIKDRVRTVYNICDTAEVIRLSENNPVEYGKENVIVTVARLGEEKGHLRCIPVFAGLKEEGKSFCWHIVGDGEKRQEILSAISRYKLEEHVFLEGEQTNPYRYIKNADYFFLPSFHEAAPMVYAEAQTLGIPILTTETLSARELIEKNNLGYVCQNSEKGIYTMLKKVLSGELPSYNKTVPDCEISKKQFEELCFDKQSER